MPVGNVEDLVFSANELGCKMGNLPTTYLGLPLGMCFNSIAGKRAKMGRASLAHIFSGQLLINPTRPDAGCGLKWAKTGQNLKKC